MGEFREVRSGGSLDRPRLDEVRQWAKERRFDVFLCYAQDRMSRNQTDTGVLYSEFAAAGVEIWTVTEGTFEQSPVGQMIRSMLAFAAEYDRERRKEATQRGQRGKARAGKLLGTSQRPLYGYRYVWNTRDDKSQKVAYEINPETAPVIRRIYEEAAAGRSIRAIAYGLTADGIIRPSGVDPVTGTWQWGIRTVGLIVRNPAYKGEGWVHAWRTEKSRTTGRVNRVKFDTEKGIRLPDGVVPALVSEELWEQVQKRISMNTNRPESRRPAGFALPGYIVCGTCGRAMTFAKRDGKRIYRCTALDIPVNPCHRPSPSIVAETVEKEVEQALRVMTCDPAYMKRELDRIMAGDEKEDDGLEEVEAAIRKGEAKLRNLTNRLALIKDETAAGAIAARINETGRTLAAQQAEVASLRRQREETKWHNWSLEQARNFFESWMELEAEPWFPWSDGKRREVLEKLNAKVTLHPTRSDKPRWELSSTLSDLRPYTDSAPCARARR